MGAAAYRDFVIEIVRSWTGQQGFQVLPRRWVVERTFGWMTRWRRLVRDYEERLDVSKAMIHVAWEACSCAASATPEHSQTGSKPLIVNPRCPRNRLCEPARREADKAVGQDFIGGARGWAEPSGPDRRLDCGDGEAMGRSGNADADRRGGAGRNDCGGGMPWAAPVGMVLVVPIPSRRRLPRNLILIGACRRKGRGRVRRIRQSADCRADRNRHWRGQTQHERAQRHPDNNRMPSPAPAGEALMRG